MQAGATFDPADDYEAAAEYVARHYGRPICSQIVAALMIVPPHVMEDIEANPQEWDRRVNEYAAGMQ